MSTWVVDLHRGMPIYYFVSYFESIYFHLEKHLLLYVVTLFIILYIIIQINNFQQTAPMFYAYSQNVLQKPQNRDICNDYELAAILTHF